jgi:hypothetical protein
MTKGYSFLIRLHNSLSPNQNTGGDYHFTKWMKHVELQFKINGNQKKSIPPEIIVMAYHIHKRNKKINTKINIVHSWLKANGYSNWCFIKVLKYLVKTYEIK